MANTPDLWRDMDRPFSSFGSFRPLMRQLDDFFNDSLMDTRFDTNSRSMVPQCDMEESDDHYLLSFDMPGLDKDNIDIELQGNMLIVSGERKMERDRGEGRSRYVERRYGRFERSIRLPQSVKSEGVEAQYENGVLRVAVPKSMDSSRQKIKIGSPSGTGILSKLANKITGHDHTVDVKSNMSSSSSGSNPSQSQSIL